MPNITTDELLKLLFQSRRQGEIKWNGSDYKRHQDNNPLAHRPYQVGRLRTKGYWRRVKRVVSAPCAKSAFSMKETEDYRERAESLRLSPLD
jgi:hypothetical protein